MKKVLFSLLAAVTLLASCQKSDLDGISDGGMVDVTLSASIDVTTLSTRATDDYGDGDEVDRAILEIYSDGVLYKRISTPVSVGAMGASFDLRLVSSQEYEFVVWADHGDYVTAYTTDSDDHSAGNDADKYYVTSNGLDEITMQGDYCGNNEFRDAFYGYKKIEDLTSSQSFTMYLTRPFGQLNVLTDLTAVSDKYLPESVKIVYSTDVATEFNALTGATSNSQSLSWSTTAEIIDLLSVETDATSVHLSTDYIFAPATGSDLHDFTMTFYNEAGEITTNDNFKNIPIQRNYRTNVSGELMTKGADITVTVTPTLTGTTSVEIQEVAAADLQTALDTDTNAVTTSYSVTDEVTSSNNTISIPSITSSETTSRSINFASGVAYSTTITITDANTTYTTNSVDELYITVPEGSTGVNISIEMPNTTVYINGTVVENVSTWASENTTIIAANSEITGTLTVKQGNVKIYGKVNKIVVESDATTGTITVCEGGELTDIEGSTLKSYTLIIESMDAEDETSFARAYTYADAVNLTTSFELSETYSIDNAWTINGNGNTITMSSRTKAQLSCNAELSLNDVTISHTVNGYALYVPNGSTDPDTKMVVNITNSTLTGYAAIYTNGDNTIFTIKDSTLNGNNISDSPFAAICVNDDATGNTLNIEGTKINTSQSGDYGYEYAIDIRENTGSTTVNLSNGTSFYYNSNSINSEDRYYFINHEVNNSERSTFTRDNTITWSSDKENMSLASGLLFGDGTEDFPYQVWDNFDLKVLQYYTSTLIFACFKQMADIEYEYLSTTFSSVSPSPMTTFPTSTTTSTSLNLSTMIADNFYGVYDGNGYKINNWGYNETATGSNWGTDRYIGFFSYVSAGSTIMDLTLTCDVSSEGISVTEDCQETKLEGVGAFAGSFGGTIINCVTEIPINVYSSNDCRVGGIYGKPLGSWNTAYTTSCTNNADITVTGLGSAGGIIGGNTNFTAIAEIRDCVVNGDVTAPYAYEIYVEPVYDMYWTGAYYLNYYVDLDKNNECNGTITSTATVE